jgi:NTP pyrophosphatase (non-canonical NTP hydrolase)
MTFEEATAKAIAFRDERNWVQFHNPKDLAISLNLEAAELLELFQWSGADLSVSDPKKREHMAEELADVAIYCIYLADVLGVNLADAISGKINANKQKYPVEKSRDCAKKYTEL